MKPYKTIQTQGEADFIERKSRFIGAVTPVSTEEEALAFLEQRKTAHWQASHNCWAYQLEGGMIQRYSDDGEPQGTAGIPILEILRKEEIFNAAIVVTRYFGGIHLGAGGLIRAYSQGAKVALDAGVRVTMTPCTLLSLPLPYPLYDRFLALAETYPMKVLETDFAQGVTLQLQLQTDYLEPLRELVTQLSSGEICFEIVGETFAPLSSNN